MSKISSKILYFYEISSISQLKDSTISTQSGDKFTEFNNQICLKYLRNFNISKLFVNLFYT